MFNNKPSLKLTKQEQQLCKEHYSAYKSACGKMYKGLKCDDVDFSKYSIEQLGEYMKKIEVAKRYSLTCNRLRKVHSDQCVGMLDKGHYHQIEYSDKLYKKCNDILKKINTRIQEIKESCRELERKVFKFNVSASEFRP